MNYSEIPFEVKLLLDANQVLTDEKQLRSDQVNMENQEIEMIDILFLDSPDLTLYQNGWIIRGRLKPNKDKWELTFKYRIKLPESDDQVVALEQALLAADTLGFDLSDPNCEIELDWSGEQKTLSLSYKVNIPIASPDRTEAWRELIMQHAPKPLRLQKWEGLDIAELVHQLNVLGPIRAQKSNGSWHGIKTCVESWYIKNGTIVEISIKAKGGEDARKKREQMKQQLEDKKLTAGQSFSKTQWALQRLIRPNLFSLLQAGGYNLYFRHAHPENTRDEHAPLSETGQEQARKMGKLFVDRQIPIQFPVRSSPINRAKLTAEIAFGEQQIQL
ncbi:histidine phosphatase family protein [Bacillus atrophaeus]|uniref:histidine phosphatase family protein n=1 Tax=Bacillus atrophaeus TaxID=1452 RepID=UPI002880BD3A|nr:histidine phosphatase family protein [Bacillus atrophaeus]MDS9996809.1 histidine phosphatase family protein [Bacillus atrophaeus]